MKVFKGIPRWRIITDIVMSCIWSLMNSVFSVLLAEVIATMTGSDKVVSTAIFFICYILVWEVQEFIADIISSMSGAVIEANVNLLYFKELYKIKPDVLKRNNTGYISGVLNKVVARQETSYRQLVLNVPICLVYILYYTWKMGSIDITLGACLITFAVAGNFHRLLVSKKSEALANDLTNAEGARNKSVIDFVSNINTVQKMKSLSFMCDVIAKGNEDCFRKTSKWVVFDEIALCGCKLIVFLYVPVCLILGSTITLGDAEQAFYNLLVVTGIQLVHNSKSLVNAISHYNKFKGSLEKLEEILTPKNLRKEFYEGDFLDVRIMDLEYSYKYDKEGINQDKIVTIKIPFFKATRGDKVCIYGESGQGKTTLLHLLSGEIENHNTVINYTCTNKNLDCVFIAQDTEMFDMTVRDNLTLGKDISDEKILYYLDMVGLGDWISSQPKFLDTMLGERGVFVSTGQRQRLNLVRGLLIEDKEVYLLDEPTSNVDEETEERMISLIKEVLKDKTVIVVTHRPKIKAICNKIYKFENGKISLEESR